MDNVYVVIISIVVMIVAACVWEVLRLRTFLSVEKEKRLQEQAEKSRRKIDVVLSDFGEDERNALEVSPEYNQIKDEEKEIRDKLLKEVLARVRAEEQQTKKRLEQNAVLEIIRDVIRNFRHSVYQRLNQPKLKEAKAKKRFVSKSNIAKEKEKRSAQNKERERVRENEKKRREQDKEQERQRQNEERRQKDEKKIQKERLEKEQRQQEDVRKMLLQKRGIENSEAQSAKVAETHVSEMEIKPSGISVTKVVAETGKAASKASGGR